MNHPPRDSIESITGEQLSAVSFVQDYVEFHFDGPVIRALTNPMALTNQRRTEFPAAGSRDQLCAFIGRTVATVDLREHEALRIDFGSGDAIVVPLDDASYRGPEALHFQVAPTAPPQVYA